jgi:hypothetical protein
MKTLFRTNKYLFVAVGIAACAIVISCAANLKAGSHRGKVEITQDVIVIHRTVQLKPPDEKAMDAVLNKYDKRLYKIDTIENGTIKRTQGNLSEAIMTEAVKAERKQAPVGLTHKSHQTICVPPCNPQFAPPVLAQKKKLIEELTPILAKYQ